MNNSSLITRNLNGLFIGQRTTDGYINATSLSVAYKNLTGKTRDITDWLSNKRTKESLQHLSSKLGIPIIELYQVFRGSPENGGGTWLHPKLATRFAIWLSDDFGLMVEEWVQDWAATRSSPIQQSLTELEILHKTVGQMVENERRTRLLEAQQQATTQRVDVIEQRLDGLNSGDTGYQTVRAYCRLHSLNIPKHQATIIGKVAGRMCRERDILIGTVADEMYGSVNSYPVEVLEEAIASFLQPVKS